MCPSQINHKKFQKKLQPNSWLNISSVFDRTCRSRYKLYSYKKETSSKNPDFALFFNDSFDKGRLKSFVLWFLRHYGQNKTIALLEQLKEIGFNYATKAGISLGIDDLKTPPQKNELLIKAERQTKQSIIQYKRAEITEIERIQQFMDTWHQTSEHLKKEVVRHFESTDILNPVYMMAFSGARGNLSQVRQLVGMRGLMSDPQGQIIDFPIQSHFREGLTLTEYIISTYGARKGIVDTALRTANAGYLTRRLVDVAQHVIVSEFDCGTKRGIVVFEMKEGHKTIYSLQNRLIGRILAKDVFIENQKIASRNDEISENLAMSLSKLTKKTFIRSPLTCRTQKFVCQLCYGWSLSTNRLVSVGETVGVIAAQSIGEPGTQLTMRTFHTGGVFSGGISDQILAQYDGIVEYDAPIPGICVRTLQGDIAFLTKSSGSMRLKTSTLPNDTECFSTLSQPSTQIFHIPSYTLLFARNGQKIFKRQIVAQLTSSSTRTKQRSNDEQVLYAEYEGETYYSYIDIFEKSDKFQDQTFEVWKWGYFWILSGKIYQFPIESYFFPKSGDFIDKNTVLNRISWMVPESCFLEINSESRHFKSINPYHKIQTKNLKLTNQNVSNSILETIKKEPNKTRKKKWDSRYSNIYTNPYKKVITQKKILQNSLKRHSFDFQSNRFQHPKMLNQQNLFPTFYISYNHRSLNHSYFSQAQKWALKSFYKNPLNHFVHEPSKNKVEKMKQISSTLLSSALFHSTHSNFIDKKNKPFIHIKDGSLFSIYDYPFQHFLKSEQISQKKNVLFYKKRKIKKKNFHLFLYDNLQNRLFYKKTIQSHLIGNQIKPLFKKLKIQKKNHSVSSKNDVWKFKKMYNYRNLYVINPYFQLSNIFYPFHKNNPSKLVLNRSKFLPQIERYKNITKSKIDSIVDQRNIHKSNHFVIKKNVFSIDIKNLFFKHFRYNFLFRFPQQPNNLRHEKFDQMVLLNSFNGFSPKNGFRENTYQWSPQPTLFLKWFPSEFQTKHNGIFMISNNFCHSSGFDPIHPFRPRSIFNQIPIYNCIPPNLSLNIAKKMNPYQLDLFLLRSKEIDDVQFSDWFKMVLSSSLFGLSKRKTHSLKKAEIDFQNAKNIQSSIQGNLDFQKIFNFLNVQKKVQFLPLNNVQIYNLFSYKSPKSPFKDEKILYIEPKIYNDTEVLEKRFKKIWNLFGFYKSQTHFYPIYKKWVFISMFENQNNKSNASLKKIVDPKKSYKISKIQKNDVILLKKRFKHDFLNHSIKKIDFKPKLLFMNKINQLRHMKLFHVPMIYNYHKYSQNGSSSFGFQLNIKIKNSLKNHLMISYPPESTKFQKSIHFMIPNKTDFKNNPVQPIKYMYKSNSFIKDKHLFLNHSSIVHKPKNQSRMHQTSNRLYNSILYMTNPFMKYLNLLIFNPIFTYESSSFEFQKYHKFFIQKHVSLFRKVQDTIKPLYQSRHKHSRTILRQIKPFISPAKSKLSANCYDLFWLPQETYSLTPSIISWLNIENQEKFLNQSCFYFLVNSNTLLFDIINRQGFKKSYVSSLNGILKISIKKTNHSNFNPLKSQTSSRRELISVHSPSQQFYDLLISQKKHLKSSDLFYTSLKQKVLTGFIKNWHSIIQKNRQNDWDFKEIQHFESLTQKTLSQFIPLKFLRRLHIQPPFSTRLFLNKDECIFNNMQNINDHSKQTKINPLNFQTTKKSVHIQIQQGWIYVSMESKSSQKVYSSDKNHSFDFQSKQTDTGPVLHTGLTSFVYNVKKHHSFFHSGKKITDDVIFENHAVYTQQIVLNPLQNQINIQIDSSKDLNDLLKNRFKPFKTSKIVKNQKCRFGSIKFNHRFINHCHNDNASTFDFQSNKESSIIALMIQPMHHKILPNPHFYKRKISRSQKKLNDPFFSILFQKNFHSYLLNKQESDQKILSLYPGLDFKVSSDFKISVIEKKKSHKIFTTSGFWHFKPSKKPNLFTKSKKLFSKKIKTHLNSFYMKSFTNQKVNIFSKFNETIYFSYYPLNFFSLKLDLFNQEHFSYPFNTSYIELNRFKNPIFSFKPSFLSLNEKRLNEFLLEKKNTKKHFKKSSDSSQSLLNTSSFDFQSKQSDSQSEFNLFQTNTFNRIDYVSSLNCISIGYQGPSFKVFLTENMNNFANQRFAVRFMTNQSLNPSFSSFISNFPLFKHQFMLYSMNMLRNRQYCGFTSFFSPLKGEILPYKKENWLSQIQRILILTTSDLFSICIHHSFYPESFKMHPILNQNTRISFLCKHIFKSKELEIKKYENRQKRKDEFKNFLNEFHQSFLITQSILQKKYDFPVFKPTNILIQHQKKLYKINGLRIGFVSPYRKLRIGSFLLYGDVIYPGHGIDKAGQIIHLSSIKITFRYAQGISASPKGILHTYNGDFVEKNDAVITLPFQTLKTGDIVQGIPKVEQYFEARTTKAGRLFIDSLPNLLYGLFERYRSVLPLEKAVRQSLLKIQQIVMNGVQRVYRSQGVGIVDKHLEVIVRQMTSKVEITNAGQSGFFPGERFDIDFIEYVNQFLKFKVVYQPVVLGITRASLEVESFLSAASFQQTTKILSHAAITRKKDFLRGLKENLIVVNLIPAGTGYLVYLNDLQISKKSFLK